MLQPMSVFVKICGLANAADVAAVAALQPDAMGVVFWPQSPRAVRPEQVAQWTRALPPGVLKVGVFVDENAAAVSRAVEIARLDVVQWHGFPAVSGQRSAAGAAAAAGFFQDLEKTLTGIAKVWKVVRLGRADVPARVDAVVLDSYSPASPGGTGQSVDWAAARAYVQASPVNVLLAGGLRAENVAEALRAVRPWGVDVSSGVEAQPGQKNLEAVKRFIEAARTAWL